MDPQRLRFLKNQDTMQGPSLSKQKIAGKNALRWGAQSVVVLDLQIWLKDISEHPF